MHKSCHSAQCLTDSSIAWLFTSNTLSTKLVDYFINKERRTPVKMQYHLHNCNDKILQLLLDEPTPARHKTLYWAAPPISFYSNQCLLLRAVRKIIIFSPGELENRSDQILLLLLSRHFLLVSFAFTTLGNLTLLRLLQRREANDLDTSLHFHQEEMPKPLAIMFEDIKQVV